MNIAQYGESVILDAIVLAGGRSSRLNQVDKAALRYRQQTLVERTVAAVPGARNVVVVGPDRSGTLTRPVLRAREDPPFGGPAAAIAAGVSTLATADPVAGDVTIVLACDMPHVATAVTALRAALPVAGAVDGVIAVDAGGRRQPLAAIYTTSSLTEAIESERNVGSLDGLSAFRLIAGLDLTEVPVPRGATDDIDTWADAERFGVDRTTATKEST